MMSCAMLKALVVCSVTLSLFYGKVTLGAESIGAESIGAESIDAEPTGAEPNNVEEPNNIYIESSLFIILDSAADRMAVFSQLKEKIAIKQAEYPQLSWNCDNHMYIWNCDKMLQGFLFAGATLDIQTKAVSYHFQKMNEFSEQNKVCWTHLRFTKLSNGSTQFNAGDNTVNIDCFSTDED